MWDNARREAHSETLDNTPPGDWVVVEDALDGLHLLDDNTHILNHVSLPPYTMLILNTVLSIQHRLSLYSLASSRISTYYI